MRQVAGGRRHDVHLLQGHGQEHWQVDRGERPAGSRVEADGQGEDEGHRVHAARGHGGHGLTGQAGGDQDHIPSDCLGADIGPKTIAAFQKTLEDANTIVWNGPMGIFEQKNFAAGTMAIAKTLAERSDKGAITIVGGGDSVSAINKSGVANKITHISTGGGASLEVLEGKILPGVAALTDA